MKKIGSLILTLCMIISMLPQTAVFASAAASGTCGDNLTWALDDAGTLTISGSGEMYDYSYSRGAPWNSSKGSINKVTIGDGVTTMGEYAFYGCSALTSVTIPDSVTTIGLGAFYGCSALTTVTIPDSVTTIGESAFDGCNNLTIYGYSGNCAENYATENSIPFIALSEDNITHGDANSDGEVDFVDALLVLKHDAGTESLSGDALSAVDVNADGEVDFVDALLILKYDAGLISSFK